MRIDPFSLDLSSSIVRVNARAGERERRHESIPLLSFPSTLSLIYSHTQWYVLQV